MNIFIHCRFLWYSYQRLLSSTISSVLGSFCCFFRATARDYYCRLPAPGLQARISAVKWMKETDQFAWNLLFDDVIDSVGFIVYVAVFRVVVVVAVVMNVVVFVVVVAVVIVVPVVILLLLLPASCSPAFKIHFSSEGLLALNWKVRCCGPCTVI